MDSGLSFPGSSFSSLQVLGEFLKEAGEKWDVADPVGFEQPFFPGANVANPFSWLPSRMPFGLSIHCRPMPAIWSR